MAESTHFAPPVGYRKCVCCGEEVKIDPFIHDQSLCQHACWYDNNVGELVIGTMKLSSWDGWKQNRRKK